MWLRAHSDRTPAPGGERERLQKRSGETSGRNSPAGPDRRATAHAKVVQLGGQTGGSQKGTLRRRDGDSGRRPTSVRE